MSGTAIVILILVVLAVIALGLLLAAALRNRRSQRLRTQFGPEYERAVQETGSRQDAERLLDERVERRRELPIRDLDPTARQRYGEEWRVVQTRFVDDPRAAVGEADDLVTAVMRDRGYPAEGFEQQVADVSVDHAAAVDKYRHAHEVLLSDARGQVATDDLRQAMVHYRELFVQLVGEPDLAPDGSRAGGTPEAVATDDPATDREPAGEPASGEPVAEEPVAEEPAADEPAADERAHRARRR